MRLAIITAAVLLALWALMALGAQAAISRATAAETVAAVLAEEEDVQVKTTAWKYKLDGEGPCLDHSVSTTKGPDETDAEWAARHMASVRYDLANGFGPAVPQSECN